MHRVVSSESELFSVVSGGMKRRATHHTNVHEHSSRSHLIVTVHVTTGGGEEERVSTVSNSCSGSSLQLNTTITPVTSTDSTPLVKYSILIKLCLVILPSFCSLYATTIIANLTPLVKYINILIKLCLVCHLNYPYNG